MPLHPVYVQGGQCRGNQIQEHLQLPVRESNDFHRVISSVKDQEDEEHVTLLRQFYADCRELFQRSDLLATPEH